MASDVLHIKDSYYFEVPKFLWRVKYDHAEDYPKWWVRLDDDYQTWEAGQICIDLEKIIPVGELPEASQLIHDYQTWKHDHANFAKPFSAYLESRAGQLELEFTAWQSQDNMGERSFEDFLSTTGKTSEAWFAKALRDGNRSEQWSEIKKYDARVDQYVKSERGNWSDEKLAAYNSKLSGKVLVPQVLGGRIRNLYEPDSGFCLSKFMVIELLVAGIIVCTFGWLGCKSRNGDAPKGRVWNFLEAILLFMRDEVARPAIGGKDADKFVPLLWTIFLFVLGCNLFGMLPWFVARTGAFAVTLAMAVVTFATVIISGSQKFGVVGFWKNQVPDMDLPFILAIFLKPMIFIIEVLGLFIKHGVLGVRLLANMVAGHLVLLGIMGLAFSVEGALSDSWAITAVISVVASTLFSCLELFVAFLQAYIFAFLSALFIGAAIHHH